LVDSSGRVRFTIYESDSDLTSFVVCRQGAVLSVLVTNVDGVRRVAKLISPSPYKRHENREMDIEDPLRGMNKRVRNERDKPIQNHKTRY
jgi:hypothetical protein